MHRAVKALFFLSLVLAATGSFTDANGWIGQAPPIAQLLPPLRVGVLHLPYAVLVAALWFYARVGARLQGPPWAFIALFLLAMAQLWVRWVEPLVYFGVVALLLRLAPRTGTLYEATSFPSLRAFAGLALLLAMSLRWGADVFGFNYVRQLSLALPSDVAMLIVCAVVVGAFIVIGRLRHRRVQPCGAGMWLAAGLVAWIAGEALHWAPPAVASADKAALVLQIAGHVLLFAGAFLLLSHLLPRREVDERA